MTWHYIFAKSTARSNNINELRVTKGPQLSKISQDASKTCAIAADLVQADYWFRLAARNPFHDNSQIRGAIEPKMTSDEMDAAKRLVDAWRPREFADLKLIFDSCGPFVTRNSLILLDRAVDFAKM